jgi:hypothetical protein
LVIDRLRAKIASLLLTNVIWWLNFASAINKNVNLYMTVKYLTDQSGNPTDVQLSIQDYLSLLEKANELPDYVKDGIKRGQNQARKALRNLPMK